MPLIYGGERKKMAYNMTFLDGNVSISDMFTGINTGLEGVFGLGIMALTFFVVFVSLKNYDSVPALITSGFITTVVGGVLWTMGIMEWGYLFLPATAVVGGALFIIINE